MVRRWARVFNALLGLSPRRLCCLAPRSSEGPHGAHWTSCWERGRHGLCRLGVGPSREDVGEGEEGPPVWRRGKVSLGLSAMTSASPSVFSLPKALISLLAREENHLPECSHPGSREEPAAALCPQRGRPAREPAWHPASCREKQLVFRIPIFSLLLFEMCVARIPRI